MLEHSARKFEIHEIKGIISSVGTPSPLHYPLDHHLPVDGGACRRGGLPLQVYVLLALQL